MDYIRQELLRQQMALYRLLLGNSAMEGAELQAPEKMPVINPEISAQVWLAPVLEGIGAFGKGKAATEPLEAVWKNAGFEAVEGTPLSDSSRSAPAAFGGKQVKWGKWGQSSTQEPWTRMVTEFLVPDAGGTSAPDELSLTFQRDARRYDGGFSLY
jgi:hypothetical protein